MRHAKSGMMPRRCASSIAVAVRAQLFETRYRRAVKMLRNDAEEGAARAVMQQRGGAPVTDAQPSSSSEAASAHAASPQPLILRVRRC